MTTHTPPPPPPYYAAPPAATRRRRWPWITAGILGIMFLGCAGLIAIGASDTTTPTAGNTHPAGEGRGHTAAATADTVNGIHVAHRGDPPDKAGQAVVTPATTWPALTDQQWLTIVHDPAAHTGEGYTVDGTVTQFDATTGPSRLLANVAGGSDTGDLHPTLTLITGQDETLAGLGGGDAFTATVTVVGASDYTTLTGGDLTVPHLQAVTVTKS